MSGDPYFANVSLLLHMDGSNGGTTFTDSSPNIFAVSRFGNAQTSTTQSKFGGASGYFDGSGDYLTMASNAKFGIGTGDYTLECWVYVDAAATRKMLFAIGSAGLSIAINASGNIEVCRSLTAIDFTFTAGISANTWTHIAVCRSGTNLTAYKNGTGLGTQTSDTSYGTGAFYIGIDANASSDPYAGYLDDFRLTKGVARYTGDFTPPTEAFANNIFDPYLNDVSLLLHMDGSNGSTTFTDKSVTPVTLTANGSAQISTTQSKFGGASAYFAGTGSYISTPASADFGFGTGDFTIEYWAYPALTGGSIQVCIDARTSDSAQPWLIGFTLAGAVRYYDGSTVRTGGTATANTWHHVAWCRVSNVNTIYLNGTAVSTYTATQNFLTTRGLVIGSNVLTTAERYVGYLDDIRITKGVARYTGNFSVPTEAYPDITYPSTDIARPRIVNPFSKTINRIHYQRL